MNFLYYCYLAILLLTFGASISRYSIADQPSRFLSLYLGITFTSEVVAFYVAKVYRNNMPVYAVANIIQLVALIAYFNFSIEVFRKNKIGLWIGILSVVAGVLNVVFLQPLRDLHSYFLIYSAVVIIASCLYAFFQILQGPDTIRLSTFPHFWFMTTLVLYWTCTLLFWGSYDYVTKNPNWSRTVNVVLLYVNILAYAAIGLVFVIYPKMKTPAQ